MLAPSASENALAVLSASPKLMAFPTPLALIVTVEPFTVTAPVVLPAVNVFPAPEDKIVLPEEERVVKMAVDGVVAPIAVALIPVAVALKLADVKRMLFAPAPKVTPLSPVASIVPEVAVRFNAPVVWVKPFDAVRRLFDVMVPVPVVLILPDVERVPFSLMLSVVKALDWMAKEVFVAALVSLMTNALSVPALVKVNDVAVPVSVDSSYSVKAISRPVVVVMLFPAL